MGTKRAHMGKKRALVAADRAHFEGKGPIYVSCYVAVTSWSGWFLFVFSGTVLSFAGFWALSIARGPHQGAWLGVARSWKLGSAHSSIFVAVFISVTVKKIEAQTKVTFLTRNITPSPNSPPRHPRACFCRSLFFLVFKAFLTWRPPRLSCFSNQLQIMWTKGHLKWPWSCQKVAKVLVIQGVFLGVGMDGLISSWILKNERANELTSWRTQRSKKDVPGIFCFLFCLAHIYPPEGPRHYAKL